MSSTVLPSTLERADRLPRLAPRRGVEAGRRLVEEDQVGVADEREREVEPPLLAARERLGALVGRRLQPRQPDRVLDVARHAVEPGPVADGLAHGQVPVQARGLEHDPDPLAQRERPPAGVQSRARPRARRTGRGSPRGSRRWSSCRRRSGRAGRTPRRAAPRTRSRARPRARRRSCAGPRPRSRRRRSSASHDGKLCRHGHALRLHRHRVEHDAAARRRRRRGAPRARRPAALLHPPGTGDRGLRADVRGRDRRGRARRRGAARGGARRRARRRSGSSPPPPSAAPPTATTSSRPCATAPGWRSRSSTGRRRRGSPSAAPPGRSARRSPGTIAVVDVGGCRPRSPSARTPAG